MEPRAVSKLLLIFTLGLLTTAPAWGQTQIYTNGPVNGNLLAWDLRVNIVSNSFTVATQSSVNGVSLWVWLLQVQPSPVLSGYITSAPCATNPPTAACGTVYGSFSNAGALSSCFLNTSTPPANVCEYTVNFPAFSIPIGTAWINLQTVAGSAGAGWDQYDGPSTAYSTALWPPTTIIPSETFSILGVPFVARH